MSKFIYAFGTEARDKLLAMRYELLKSDADRQVFVFLNQEHQRFSCGDVPYAMSDVLTF